VRGVGWRRVGPTPVYSHQLTTSSRRLTRFEERLHISDAWQRCLNLEVGFDVVVAGGGTAGCVVAARLSEESSRSVCLVEAGPDYGPYGQGRWPADLLDGWQLAFSHSWETEREDRSQLRARVVGGCSAHNACVVLRGAASDYDWGDGWSYAALEPYFDRAEAMLRVRKLTEAELTPWHAAWADAGDGDVILHPVNMVGRVRWNAAFAYLDPARGRPNLTILAKTLVDRIEGDRLVTDRGDIEAGVVVLTAGAYGSPAILLRSGLGPPVGENLRDHVGAGIGWEPTRRLLEEVDALPMAQITICRRDGDVFLFPALDDGPEISAAAFAMKPRSTGRVQLNDRDPRTPLAIDHGFLTEPRDTDVVADGIDGLRELAASPQVRPYIAREVRPGQKVSALDHARAACRGFFHPVGTCALGIVTEPDGRARGLDRVYVADASFMPELPRAQINLTVAAVAERLAERLANAS
jgi:choline dehydrogenase-like flavoprotein